MTGPSDGVFLQDFPARRWLGPDRPGPGSMAKSVDPRVVQAYRGAMPSPRLSQTDPQHGSLWLDAPRVQDAADWSAAQDAECARWFGWPCPPGLERCRAHLEHLVLDDDPDTFTWAIRTPAGFAGGIDLKRHDDAWNVSYFVHPGQRGHQVATRALARVCRWAFDTLHIEEVATRVHEGNAASRRVLQKAGFHLVGSETSPDADHLDLVYVLRRPAGGVG